MITNTEIIAYLKKGGFLFELECIEVFKELGFTIIPSIYYEDKNTGLQREVDFVAEKSFHFRENDFTFNVSFVIECKNHISPIIGTSVNSNLSKEEIVSNLIYTNNVEILIKQMVLDNEIDNFTFGLSKNEMVCQNVISYKTKENSDKKDRVYESIMKSLDASLFLKNKSNSSDLRFGNIIIPCVIFNNDLHLVELKDGNPTVKKVSYFKSSKHFPFNHKDFFNLVHIVSYNDLKKYCENVLSDSLNLYNSYNGLIKEIGRKQPTNSNKGNYDLR